MEGLKYTEFMGENVKDKLKYCGKDVRLYQLAKIELPQFVEIDDHCIIFDFAFLNGRKSLKIGKYCCITWHCVLEGGANIRLGDRVFLGPGSKLLSSTYDFNGLYTSQLLPEGAYNIRYGDITLEDDAYIGAGTVVMPGVTIGEGALVGANAFVNKDLEPWGIYVGAPAKKIGDRRKPTPECEAIIKDIDWSKHF